MGRWAPDLRVRVSREGKGMEEKGPRVTWSYHPHALRVAERRDGKFARRVTAPKVSVKEAGNAHLEKDCIEKGFRTMQTDEEMEPVRHYRPRRDRAYEFVRGLAFRLRAARRGSLREEAGKVGGTRGSTRKTCRGPGGASSGSKWRWGSNGVCGTGIGGRGPRRIGKGSATTSYSTKRQSRERKRSR